GCQSSLFAVARGLFRTVEVRVFIVLFPSYFRESIAIMKKSMHLLPSFVNQSEHRFTKKNRKSEWVEGGKYPGKLCLILAL
ncbi:MAG: hypothetical protein KBB51_01315, partial [Candidatus Moranbacteria bacterium]|nr:hypothetical protein [Candidatus Moranbacteria bacterium]